MIKDIKRRCEAATTKKAWSNPHAPPARCTRGAVEGSCFCAMHERKAKEREARTPTWQREFMKGGR